MRSSSSKRRHVAREAARLLYFRFASEYYEAKRQAAENLGVSVLPSNREVAVELDRLADLLEGEGRRRRMVKLRLEALRVMKALREFNPVLVGSVWRGTAREGSDIDIRVYAEDPQEVVEKAKGNGEVVRVKEEGKEKLRKYVHVYLKTAEGITVEVVVRPPEERGLREKCEVFGDEVKGLTISELERVLREDPCKKFIPE
nr:DUF4269 domain-containing protein [Candidatus Freyrarchaeum guaymaensis]